MCSYHSITSVCDGVFALHELSLPCCTWPRKEVEDVLLTCSMTFGENLNESLRCVDLVVVYLMYVFCLFLQYLKMFIFDFINATLTIMWWPTVYTGHPLMALWVLQDYILTRSCLSVVVPTWSVWKIYAKQYPNCVFMNSKKLSSTCLKLNNQFGSLFEVLGDENVAQNVVNSNCTSWNWSPIVVGMLILVSLGTMFTAN